MVLDFINAHVWVVSIGVVVLLFGARVIAKSEGPTLWPILPKWLDVTTWSEAGWSGRLAQVALTSVLAGGTVMAAALADGQLTEAELKAAGMAILEALGIYHGAKNLVSGVKLPKTSVKTTLPSIVLLALLLGGCGGWQGKAQDAPAGAEAVCQNQLLRSPERERLLAQGFAPAEVVAIFDQVCTGIETFGPGVDAILEAAKQQRSLPSRALAAEGRSLGLLP